MEMGDANAVAGLSAQFGYPTGTEDASKWVSAMLRSKVDAAWVAILGNEVVGWMQVTRMVRLESGEFAEITGLVVDESRRSQGIGRLLVAQARAWAQVQGLPRLVVRANVVRSRAHGFYLKVGFQEKKLQKVFELVVG